MPDSQLSIQDQKKSPSISRPLSALRMLAMGFAIAGIILVVLVGRLSHSKLLQIIFLLMYSVVSAGFLLARARSYLQWHANQQSKRETKR